MSSKHTASACQIVWHVPGRVAQTEEQLFPHSWTYFHTSLCCCGGAPDRTSPISTDEGEGTWGELAFVCESCPAVAFDCLPWLDWLLAHPSASSVCFSHTLSHISSGGTKPACWLVDRYTFSSWQQATCSLVVSHPFALNVAAPELQVISHISETKD